jgi:hypothetical protein
VPFTLAHPAAILPLRGSRYLRTVPLMIGAMAPDLPYFAPGSFGRFLPETHEFEASYSGDLVLGYLLLAAVYILRRPLTALMTPRAHWLSLHALAPLRERRSEWLFAGVAIVIGVWTHLLWDSFTHLDGWVVRRVSALSAPVRVGEFTEPVCHVLQYASSVVGLIILAVWYLRLPAPARVAADPHAPSSAVRPILALIVTASMLIGGVQATAYFHHSHQIYRTLNILLTHSIAWFATLAVIAGLVITLEHKAEPLVRR